MVVALLQTEQLVERLPLRAVTVAEGSPRLPPDVELPRENVAAPACPRAFTLEVEAEVVQEPVDPIEGEPPARVEPFIARERAHDSEHRLAVVPEELLRELDPLVAAVAPELAFVRVELEPPHHTVGEKRLGFLAQPRQDLLHETARSAVHAQSDVEMRIGVAD